MLVEQQAAKLGEIKMANLLGTTVATNYAKTSPSSRFGTRDLTFYSVALTGVETGFADSNSTFAQAVRGIMLNAEVFFIGTPAAGAFVVAVAADTAGNEVEGASARTLSLKEAVDLSTAGSSTVTELAASGASIA